MNYGKQIEKYLVKIDEGKAIAYSQFLLLLTSSELNLDVSNKDFEVRKLSGNAYRVISIAPWLRDELDKIVAEAPVDRNSAARQNNSHAYSVNGSMLLVREGASNPKVVMFDTDGKFSPESKGYTHALLVENRQNFISIDKTIPFVAEHCDISDTDMRSMLTVFTEGNAISNFLHKPFLSQFKTLFLLLDVDAGGLQITSNLITLLPDSHFVFLAPMNIRERLESVRAPAKTEAVEKAIRLGRKHPQLTHIAQLIYDTKRELEQESYLDE